MRHFDSPLHCIQIVYIHFKKEQDSVDYLHGLSVPCFASFELVQMVRSVRLNVPMCSSAGQRSRDRERAVGKERARRLDDGVRRVPKLLLERDGLSAVFVIATFPTGFVSRSRNRFDTDTENRGSLMDHKA